LTFWANLFNLVLIYLSTIKFFYLMPLVSSIMTPNRCRTFKIQHE